MKKVFDTKCYQTRTFQVMNFGVTTSILFCNLHIYNHLLFQIFKSNLEIIRTELQITSGDSFHFTITWLFKNSY